SGGEQQRFGPRVPSVRLARQQEVPDRFGARAAARLTPLNHLVAARADLRGQSAQLGRLTDAFAALKGDEAAAHAQPNREVSPAQTRPKKPASPTSVSATSGMTCGVVSPVVTTRSATC